MIISIKGSLVIAIIFLKDIRQSSAADHGYRSAISRRWRSTIRRIFDRESFNSLSQPNSWAIGVTGIAVDFLGMAKNLTFKSSGYAVILSIATSLSVFLLRYPGLGL
ncbi:hypothetical protein [Siphonobacter curvatus]|uniref:hypothetical protein n=1 Tax=Siphonobacter curvatus TaxID=2094562 RepID=UPI0013FDADFB|nr:hypothetical protein [Siphonobacter curvatus]